MTDARPFVIATRGSALALAQANMVAEQCRRALPGHRFELSIIKTTGDKLQTASLARPDASLPKGLFTKELEAALLSNQADLAVHSLKDLPTELPSGLTLGAVSSREDVRDVFIFRNAAHPFPDSTPARRSFPPGTRLTDLPPGLVIGTSSTRRSAQLLALRPDWSTVELRGNVATRMHKLADKPELDGILLAAAGLARLGFRISGDGRLSGEGIPDGLLCTPLEPELMLPCVGQAALGIEVRENDPRIAPVCDALNHPETWTAVTAERAFLRAMGGGCQSPVAALACIDPAQMDGPLQLRTAALIDGGIRRVTVRGSTSDPAGLGAEAARQLKGIS